MFFKYFSFFFLFYLKADQVCRSNNVSAISSLKIESISILEMKRNDLRNATFSCFLLPVFLEEISSDNIRSTPNFNSFEQFVPSTTRVFTSFIFVCSLLTDSREILVTLSVSLSHFLTTTTFSNNASLKIAIQINHEHESTLHWITEFVSWSKAGTVLLTMVRFSDDCK